MSEFWRRWHISLILWITDYIYLPLSYNYRKYKNWGVVISLFITFIIAGIWHGAGFVFIIWGLLQGLFLSIEALTNKSKKRFIKKYNLNKNKGYIILSVLFTYFLFAFSEIFGGSTSSAPDAINVIKKIITDFRGPIYYDKPSMILFLMIGIITLFFVEWKNEFYKGTFSFFDNKNWIIRNLSYAYLILLIFLVGVFDGGQFIYFKF
jgi:alginate O-acetyltransferase complex protein AlgI